MNYELAKKLKEAGFSHEIKHGDYAYCDCCEEEHLIHEDNDEGCLCGYDYAHRFKEVKTWTKSPSLSELIEACGDINLSNCDENHKGWIAGIKLSGWDDGSGWVDTDSKFGKGNTPEEAVAELWLAINQCSKE